MRVLVLGGSWFVGRMVVADAVRRGHEVTIFNRGVSLAPAPAGARLVRGDREQVREVRALVRQRPWDVVLDVSGCRPPRWRLSLVTLHPPPATSRCLVLTSHEPPLRAAPPHG